MSDIIGRTVPVSPRTAEKIAATSPSVATKRERPHDDAAYEDQVDIAPQRHLEQGPEQITLSLDMVRAIIEDELPDEVIQAIEAFAPLGDRHEIARYYRLLSDNGHESVEWSKTMTLEQALEAAAY